MGSESPRQDFSMVSTPILNFFFRAHRSWLGLAFAEPERGLTRVGFRRDVACGGKGEELLKRMSTEPAVLAALQTLVETARGGHRGGHAHEGQVVS